MHRPLNIAHCVESYYPVVGGMQEVVKQLSERIAKLGHRVTVLTSNHVQRDFTEWNGVQVKGFTVNGNPVDGYHGDVEKYWEALKDGDFDVVTLFAAQQWSADIVLQRAKDLKAKKVFVPTGFSRLHHPAFKEYFQRMPEWLMKMDLNIFLSNDYQDINFARQHGIDALTVIPNGAAEEEFTAPLTRDLRKELRITQEQQVLVHVGSYTGIKGHEETVRVFIDAEIGNAVLVFAGSDIDRFKAYYRKNLKFAFLRWKQRWKKKQIFFLQLDRPATVDAIRAADLFFFPSRVECSPIVLFEAMAAGVPFFASNAGNSQEIAHWSNGGWIMPGKKDENGWEDVDIKSAAQLLQKILSNRKELKEAGQKGQVVWKEKFTWQRISERYIEVYEGLVTGE